MGFLRSVLHYASIAWGVVSGAISDPAEAFQAVWKFIGSVQVLIDHLFSRVNRSVLEAMLYYISIVDAALREYLGALRRIASWIWGNQVNPVRLNLIGRIAALRRWTKAWLIKLMLLEIRLYWQSLRYSYQLVMLERKYRLSDIKMARAYSVRLVKAALATVDREAADGYASQTKARELVIARIADDLAVRNPVIKDAVKELVSLMLDAAEIDDPLIRFALSKVLQEIIDKLGIDRVAGDLMSTLIADLTGNRPSRTLEQVTADTARRLAALEGQWAQFMENGGPELEQAGNQWKAYGSILGDAAITAFFALAVADPAEWAKVVNDTAGTLVNDSASVVADLFREV